MQPPRPFQGVPYDKDMFSFLPALTNQNVLVESSRKRKLWASDSQMTTPAPTMAYDSLGNLYPQGNAGDLRRKEVQSFVPSSPRKSSTFRDHLDSAKFGNQNDSSAPLYSDERACHEYFPFIGQSQSSNYNESPSLVQSSASLNHESSNCSTLVTEYFNQNGSHDSNAHLGEDENGLRIRKSQSYGLQMPTLMKVEGSNFNERINGESQNMQQNVSNPGVYTVSSDEKGPNEHSYQADTSANIGLDDTSNFLRVEGTKMLGDNVGYSIHNLLETNSILQQALRLLSASSGTGLTINQDGSIQGCEGDATKIKLTINPHTQNLSHSSIDVTPSMGGEACRNLDKTIISGDGGSVNVNDGLKSEFGGSSLSEKLWDGTLQLSSSVSVSAIAFFKSGEWMQDFSLSGSVEVKGKVRLEAFEKYIQDLPRSRSRGLMVMSLLAKEGSSAANLKNMTEVATKYKEGKRVGIAQLNKGVDIYICPHSDAVITILAKHGFFNGMAAVKEKSDPLLGCVVWRRKLTSAPASETAVIDAPHSGASLSNLSYENSEKIQNEVGSGNNSSVNKSPELSIGPCIGQPELSMIPENNLTSVSVNNTQLSEFHSNVETIAPNSSNIPVLNQSTVLSDDEDLPEYDFGAVISQTFDSQSSVAVLYSPTPESEQFKDSHVNQPIAAQMRSESSTVSEVLPDLRFQGQPQNMKHQSEAHNSSIPAQQEKQIGDYTISLRPSVQGLAPGNMGHQPETRIPSWSNEEQKLVDSWTATKKPKNLFDDDEMPEWYPPDFKTMKTEVNERPGPSFGSSNPMVSRSSFTDLATGRQLPSPPPLPPLPPRAVAQVWILDKDHSTENQLSTLPPLPPLPPPPTVAQGQLFDINHSTEHQRSLPPPLPPLPPPTTVVQPQLLDKNRPTEYQRSLHPPLPPLPPPAVAQVQLFDNNHPTEHQRALPTPLPPLPPPADAQVQFLRKNRLTEHQRSLTPPLPPLPHPAEAQVQLLDKNHPTEHRRSLTPPLPPLPHPAEAQVQLLDKNHPTEHYRFLPPPLPPIPPAAVTKEQRLDKHHPTEHQYSRPPPPSRPPRPLSTQGQLFDRDYPPVPHSPKPAVNALMHGNSYAEEPSKHYSSPAAQPRTRFQSKEYPPPLPPNPPPPLNRPHYSDDKRHGPHFSKPSVNNFTRDGSVAQSSLARFQDQCYSPAPHFPPPVPEKSTANNLMHERSADVSTRRRFQNNDHSSPCARPPADMPEAGGSRDEVPPFPPGFTQNFAFRPQFNWHRMNNHAHHSNWRNSRS
ncbi:hypothetical protein RND81_07G111400 [Saponaria officinalis]